MQVNRKTPFVWNQDCFVFHASHAFVRCGNQSCWRIQMEGGGIADRDVPLFVNSSLASLSNGIEHAYTLVIAEHGSYFLGVVSRMYSALAYSCEFSLRSK
jgi:hypothetical protein